MSIESSFKEECWFLYGYRIRKQTFRRTYSFFLGIKRYHTIGTAAQVEMDYSKAKNPLVIGWHHTHPGEWNVLPSATDNSTMRSWVKSMYKS